MSVENGACVLFYKMNDHSWLMNCIFFVVDKKLKSLKVAKSEDDDCSEDG